MEQKTIIEIASAVPRFEQLRFDKPIDWKIEDGQHWAIIGPNGGGKTLLTDILLSKYALKSGEIICKDEKGNNLPVSSVVKSVAFRDIYSIVDTQNSYYQQRWNKGDEQVVPVVKELVKNADQTWLDTLIGWFEISELMEKEVNMLSSGELRKFLIVRSLLSRPRIMILDNPFIGLDAASRVVLNDLLTRLSNLEHLQIVLVLSNPADIPDMITNILPIGDKHIYPATSKNEFCNNKEFIENLFKTTKTGDIEKLKDNYKNDWLAFENAATLKNIQIRYGARTILKDLDWQVKRGEKWALLGVNGSGKSTLLSLICGDNPQAYANDITLFDRKRGTGESIWDIKKRIGYVSPEMHLYYLKNVRCLDVVSSGFFDTIGLYRKCNEEQEKVALEWMKIFNIEHIKDVSFLNISSGEQRLILLARVFVKNPDLLILDEPLHGLDIVNKQRVKKIIEDFCDADKSLIYVTHYEDEIPNTVSDRLVLEKRQ
ncbi:ATP-binding cassette domain-containing protein [Dysgonomonas sp. ZJ279]|uniref:ATP-binding cassette domain-containing protein n=1 Tax=Dysgonomonas sp. ZJ279 TaxID=2709796 RepID=UPI0013E9BF96|nr:ATP-binding cassette domain-containing protein [Dysgonomonas sp. ZJ279]